MDERADLLANHKILNKCKNEFCHQTETHTAEPFVPEPSAFEVEVAVGKLKKYKSLGVDQIPEDLIQA
jgi:hypothetical protein